MKYINLTQGYQAIVDDDDYEWLSKIKWYAAKYKNNRIYANRGITKNGKTKTYQMHRCIMINRYGEVTDGKFIDHIDGNELNNQKSNLRFVTRSENRLNSRINSNNSSGIKGVWYHRFSGLWGTRCGEKTIYCKTKEDAYEAYKQGVLSRDEIAYKRL